MNFLKKFDWHGALLIHKEPDITSYGVVRTLQTTLWNRIQAESTAQGNTQKIKKDDLPKLGHGGTLDPFASGLLLVLVGRGVKLARYFLGSQKTYAGTIHFGHSTSSGDHTTPITQTTHITPQSLTDIQNAALQLSSQPYWQIPPMYSAKKQQGQPLYRLARQGIETERAAVRCTLDAFQILTYQDHHAEFSVRCSAGTYIRTLAEDLAKILGSLATLERLHRVHSGSFQISDALTLPQLQSTEFKQTPWPALPCWISFDRLLAALPMLSISSNEQQALIQGKQTVFQQIMERHVEVQLSSPSPVSDLITLYSGQTLVAIARKGPENWSLERVFIA
jgi:tRNA pseudouridine55 synthase